MEKKAAENLQDSKRTLTRLICAQILYQFQLFKEEKSLDEIKNDLIDNYVLFEGEEEESYRKKIDEKLLDNLLIGVCEIEKSLDEDINSLQKKSQEIDNLLIQILRLGALELKLSNDIPFASIINEYVDISSCFFDDSKVNFTNSILENLAKKYDRK